LWPKAALLVAPVDVLYVLLGARGHHIGCFGLLDRRGGVVLAGEVAQRL
jgi:hypothetical protein